MHNKPWWGCYRPRERETERAGRKPAESSLFLQGSHSQAAQTLEQSKSDCTGIQLHIKIHIHRRSLCLNFSKEEPKGFGQSVKFFKLSVAIWSLKPSAWSSGAQPRYSDLNIPWLRLCWNSPSSVTFLAGTTACLMHVHSLNCRMGSHLSLQTSKHCQG